MFGYMNAIPEALAQGITSTVESFTAFLNRVTHDPVWMAGAAAVVVGLIVLMILKKRASG
jgi:hypothetical protein